VATLKIRIGGNHLNGNVGSSTFRKTLTAVLRGPLGLRLAGPNRLDPASNATLSAWMRAHLRVVTVPYPDRTTLAIVEHTVLNRLDPPLNLMGIAPTLNRAKLRQLRAELSLP
jgi:GIY-YIG catalytic domain-containing protein